MIEKVGQITSLSKVKRNVTPQVVNNVKSNVINNIKEVPESKSFEGNIIEPLDKDNFLYFWARAISAGETSGPNDNGDYFPLEELIKSYKTFVGRGLFLNHQANDVRNAVGKIIDAQIVVDPETKEVWVECLCKIDKKLFPDLCRQIETGIIDSVSMGCSVKSCICSVCNKEFTAVEDFCEHLTKGILKEYQVGDNLIKAYSINRGITFKELSLVTVPADNFAKISNIIANNITTLLNKESNLLEENMDKKAGKIVDENKTKIETTVDEQKTNTFILEPDKKVNLEEIKTTKEEQDELKAVLSKLNAFEFLKVAKFLKDENLVENLKRYDEKDFEMADKETEDLAKEIKQNPIPSEFKDIKKDIIDRTSGKIEDKPYKDDKKDNEEIENLKRDVLKRTASERLNEVKKKILKYKLAKKIEEIKKEASKDGAKPGGKEYYYFTGIKEPKPEFVDNTKTYYMGKDLGDVTEVNPNTQTDSYEKQYDKEKSKKTDEWEKSNINVNKEIEEQNTIMKTRKQMGFLPKVEVKKAENGEVLITKYSEDNKINEIVVISKKGKSVLYKTDKKEKIEEQKDSKNEKVNKIENKEESKPIIKIKKSEDGQILMLKYSGDDLENIKVISAKKDQKDKDDETKKQNPLNELLNTMTKNDKETKESEISTKKDETLSEEEIKKEVPETEENLEKEDDKKTKESGINKVVDKIKEIWNEMGLNLKDFKVKKSNQSGYEYIIDLLDDLYKNLKEEKAEIKSPELPSEKEKKEKEEDIKSKLQQKFIEIKAIVDELKNKNLLEPDTETYNRLKEEGKSILEAREEAMKAAEEKKIKALLQMDDISLRAFKESISGIRKVASKEIELSQPINITITEIDQNSKLDEIFKMMD